MDIIGSTEYNKKQKQEEKSDSVELGLMRDLWNEKQREDGVCNRMATEKDFVERDRIREEKRREENRKKAWGSEAGEKEGEKWHVAVRAKWESVEIRIEEKSGVILMHAGPTSAPSALSVFLFLLFIIPKSQIIIYNKFI